MAPRVAQLSPASQAEIGAVILPPPVPRSAATMPMFAAAAAERSKKKRSVAEGALAADSAASGAAALARSRRDAACGPVKLLEEDWAPEADTVFEMVSSQTQHLKWVCILRDGERHWTRWDQSWVGVCESAKCLSKLFRKGQLMTTVTAPL